MASSVDRRIEGYLPEDMGQCDLASLIRPRSTEPIRACGPWPRQQAGHMTANVPSDPHTPKVLASRGPSTHVLGPRDARTRGPEPRNDAYFRFRGHDEARVWY